MDGEQSRGWLSIVPTLFRPKHDGDTDTAHAQLIPSGCGLHAIWEPNDAQVETWYEPKSKTFWPLDPLPKHIPFARIFIWEYDADVFRKWVTHHASTNNLGAHGSKLCLNLANRRYRTSTQRRPIVFIGHSLGGLVIQRALLHSEECSDKLYKDIVDSTAGVIFLGTPHRGSNFANWGSLCTGFLSNVKEMNEAIINLLRPESEVLFQLRDSFIKLVIRRAEEKTNKLRVHCYFEEYGMTMVGKIVTAHSAIFEGYSYSSIHADHVTMTKFGYHNGQLDLAYTDVMECIWMMTEHAKTLDMSKRTLVAKITQKRPHSSEQNSPTSTGLSDPFKPFPENIDYIHHPLIASALWDNGRAEPSRIFLSNAKSKRARTKSPIIPELASSESSLQRTNSLNDRFSELVENQETQPPHADALKAHSPEQVLLVAKWLSTIDHREMHDFHGSKEYRVAGIWLSGVAEFQDWRDRPRSSIFWLHGSAGIGKTILSSFLIDTLSANTDVTVLYFYCSFKLTCDHVLVLRSLMKQLYLRSTSKETAEDFYRSHEGKAVCDGSETELKAYYNLFLQSLSTPLTYIVIDGVDECTHDVLENLLKAWDYISQRSPEVVKLFISSRKTRDITSIVERKLHQHCGGTQMSLDTSHGQIADIDSFIDGRIEEVSKQWGRWQNSGPTLFSTAKSKLMQHSGGSYLWVRLMIDLWYPSADVSDQGSRPQLADPPPTLTHLYNTYMALIATKNPIIASIAGKTFYWVTFAQEPLPAQDIAFAITLGLNEADEETVRPIDGPKLAQYCNGMVHFQKPDRLLFYHPAIMEFLCQRLDNSLAHMYLAKICMKSLTTMAAQRDRNDMAKEDKSSAEGLFAYAQKHYMMHGFKAIASDQRVGPFVDADTLPTFENMHQMQTRDHDETA